MRVAAILGLGCSPKSLKPFQSDTSQVAKDKDIEWQLGMPASADETDVILLFGGDGTIHWHLGQLMRLGLPVLVVPAGSGNDFARALGLRRVRDSLAAWRKFCGGAANVCAVDLGVISAVESSGGVPFDKLRAGSSTIAQSRSAPHDPARDLPPGTRYFSCVAGIGLDGEVSRRANRLPRWLRGHGGYVLSLAPAIFTFAPLPMKILAPVKDTDGSGGWTMRCDQPTILAAFANTPSFGGGMRIAPRAKMDDGLLDVCVVGGIDPFKLFCMFPTIYGGHHLDIKEVKYFQAARLRVETEHPIDVYADGEYVCRTPVEVAVQRAALKVVVPVIG
jgi:diacylglycerol kinase (ATP)